MNSIYRNAVAYNTDDERLREFIYRFRIEEVTTEPRQTYSSDSYSEYTLDNPSFYSPYTVRYEITEVVSVKIPLDYFKRLAHTVMEFDELMTYPESRSLIQEAKFLYRLRHGATF